MKGLLYKEWAILTSSYKQSVFFIAFLYGGISILTGQTGMAYALLVVFSILITSTISFDENSHWDIYARTLPVTPAQLVGSKYLFGLCGLALGTVCTVLIVALNNVLPPLLFWHAAYKVPPLECLATRRAGKSVHPRRSAARHIPAKGHPCSPETAAARCAGTRWNPQSAQGPP